MMLKAILLLAVLAFSALAQSPPVWPVRFQQDFVQSWASTQYRDAGKLWYDSQRVMSRLDRTNGRYDPLCSGITKGNTPCSQLVRNGKRYIFFPLIKLCCFCCDSSQGCGILRRDWLKVTKFVGKDELSGQFFNKFVSTDDEIDYWATTDANTVPRKLVEGGENFKDFILNTYSEASIPDSVFALPSYCDGTKCPAVLDCA